MEKWIIKIKTLKCGPGGTVQPGEIYEEYANIAEQLIKSGQAELISKPIKEIPKKEIKKEEIIIETATAENKETTTGIGHKKKYNKKK